MTDRIVAVFGVTGFLGRRVVCHLGRSGFAVRAASGHPERGREVFSADDIRPDSIAADIHDERSVADAVAAGFGVLNAVSLYGREGPGDVSVRAREAAQRIALWLPKLVGEIIGSPC